MNSTLLLALNAVALAVLMMFHIQSDVGNAVVNVSQAGSHRLQQRPQLAVMTAKTQSAMQAAQDTQAAPSSDHLIF
ncbi:hypothetical protein GIR22_23045 [Pseudomonas sp. CCM 7891]|uniref:Uncharacterized protein n=1 Tax=Pseudomonas karstica TaxID=1055468 RepID=A0A7X2RWA9_9PSED|nr:hypothetical protein [Pseudomonas karstica]MTD22009.1 hypothetical protein [Pseudomonas karstica]